MDDNFMEVGDLTPINIRREVKYNMIRLGYFENEFIKYEVKEKCSHGYHGYSPPFSTDLVIKTNSSKDDVEKSIKFIKQIEEELNQKEKDNQLLIQIENWKSEYRNLTEQTARNNRLYEEQIKELKDKYNNKRFWE